MMRKLLFFLLALFFARSAGAQQFSYVYLQSDKETPIYVKLEGEMLPRYGQHYNIISRLAPGAINIEVLFQQNKFSPQKFTLLVPENGQRSLLLTRRDDAWALYDLRQKFYILAGNIASEDRYNAPNRTAEQAPETVADRDEMPTPKATETEAPIARTPAVTQPVTSPNDEPKFIPDLELSRGNTKPKKTTKKTPVEKAKTVETPPPVSVENADRETCGQQMTIDEFSTFYSQVLAQSGLDERLTFLMDSDQCPTPYQARIIARSLTGDAPRLRYMSRVVRRSAAPKSFLPLTNLFSDAQSADAFRTVINSL